MIPNDLAGLTSAYEPSDRARAVLEATPTLLIVGISGAGKGTIRDALLQTGGYYNIATHVTRPPRYNNGIMETEGVEHHFISPDQARAMLENKDFIEANFHFGNLYAASIAEFERARDEHKVALADIDINGVENFRKLSDKVMPIFLVPPSYEVWINRLKNRFTDGWYKHIDDIRGRTERASYELEYVLGRNDYYLVINDILEETIHAVEAIIAGRSQTAKEIAKAREVMRDIKRHVDSGTLDD